MGYAGKIVLREKAILLRRQGISIKEIQKRLKVSRSSISIWVRDVVLSKEKIKALYLNKKTGALRGSIIAAENKKRKRANQVELLRAEGKKDVVSLSSRDRFIAGIALYFAEGAKRDGAVSFSNSDPRSIVFMMGWLREFCKVPEKKFRCSVYLHDNLNESKTKKFWSRVVEIPLAQFTKTYIVKSRSDRFRKTKHLQGIFRITVSDATLHRRIMGWIEGLFQNIIIPR